MTDKNQNQDGKKNRNSMPVPAKSLSLAAFLLSLSLLTACATTPATSPGDPVRERAEARWAALLSQDFEGAYALYSPGYRETTTLVDFAISVRLRKVQWTASEYREHSCEETVCKVVFSVSYMARNPVPGLDVWRGDSLAEETWIFSDGNWWYLSSE